MIKINTLFSVYVFSVSCFLLLTAWTFNTENILYKYLNLLQNVLNEEIMFVLLN